MRLATIIAAAAAVLFAAPTARAEVTEAQDWGFQVRHVFDVSAPPEKIWPVMVEPARWWDPDHSWFGKAEGLTLDLRPGGCFCETGPNGAGARHMAVQFVNPNEALHLWGALGPLHMQGVTGGLMMQLKADGKGGTTLTVTYSVGGFAKGGLKTWAPLVDKVIGHQFGRLERVVETGKA